MQIYALSLKVVEQECNLYDAKGLVDMQGGRPPVWRDPVGKTCAAFASLASDRHRPA